MPKEINIALRRQQGVAVGFSFLLPAYLADCENAKLAELQRLQYRELQSEAGIAALAVDIRSDQEARHRRENLSAVTACPWPQSGFTSGHWNKPDAPS
ncbi:MAG: hypothetical protein EPN21_13830 [Methylococcaceae bacterium]|nr:MAG: hypothetical protein EPN21_13830 [Methylococcaceae bacterium]